MHCHAKPRRRAHAPVSELESHVGFWLRFVANHVSGAFARRLEERGFSVSEWVALRLLFDTKAVTSTSLVARIGMTKGAVTKVVDRLVGKQLVTRRLDADDRRVQRLSLTRAGRTVVPRLAALADANDEHYFGHLRAAERRALIGAMRTIVERLGLAGVPTE